MADIPARNCLFSVANYGGVLVNATRIQHGVTILAVEASARHHRTFLPWKQTSGSCQITIKHSSKTDYVQFNEWMKVYAESISSPDGAYGAMRVYIPVIKFDRMCIPSGGIKFGRTFSDFVWTQTISFMGASDPIDLTDVSAGISYGVGVTRYVGTSTEEQSSYSIATLGGMSALGGTLEDALYNSTKTAGIDTIPGGDQSINNAGQSFG